MHRIARYAVWSCMLGAAVGGSSAVAFLIAIDVFAPQKLTTKASPELPPSYSDTPSDTAPQHGQLTFSDLVGTIAEPTDSKLNLGSTNAALSNGEWVEVTDAVNMRSGPSSANPVLQVHLKGAHLRVASRNGKWIEVVDANTSREGWVYEKFVKPITPTSRQADLVRDSSG
jgi:uncharacterized protein YgiM (DUF1202 family)